MSCPNCPIDLDHNYNLYVIKPDSMSRQDLQLVSETQIPQTILNKMANGQKFLVFGNVDVSADSNSFSNIRIPDLSTNRLHCSIQEWFQFGATAPAQFKAIVLTKSRSPFRLSTMTGRGFPKIRGDLLNTYLLSMLSWY